MFRGYIQGWNALKSQILNSDEAPLHKFSILIPARNEQEHIWKCLAMALNQSYPYDYYEVIVIDDFSDDKTTKLVNAYIELYPNISLISLSDYLPSGLNSYKKKGLTIGVEKAKYDWIITTDADCIPNKDWLKAINQFIRENKDAQLISAPVKIAEKSEFDPKERFWEIFQRFEFSGLNAIGASYIANQSPTMCNGANMIYRKSAFYDVGGYEGVEHIASGDDEFLMHKIAEKYPSDIHFLKSKEAIVSTEAVKTISYFISQRRRWVSKSRKYTNKKITFQLLKAYLFMAWMFFLLILIPFNYHIVICFLFLFLTKVMIEKSFYQKTLPFYEQEDLIKYIVRASFLHFIYVFFIGLIGNFGSYHWKGRTVK